MFKSINCRSSLGTILINHGTKLQKFRSHLAGLKVTSYFTERHISVHTFQVTRSLVIMSTEINIYAKVIKLPSNKKCEIQRDLSQMKVFARVTYLNEDCEIG